MVIRLDCDWYYSLHWEKWWYVSSLPCWDTGEIKYSSKDVFPVSSDPWSRPQLFSTFLSWIIDNSDVIFLAFFLGWELASIMSLLWSEGEIWPLKTKVNLHCFSDVLLPVSLTLQVLHKSRTIWLILSNPVFKIALRLLLCFSSVFLAHMSYSPRTLEVCTLISRALNHLAVGQIDLDHLSIRML